MSNQREQTLLDRIGPLRVIPRPLVDLAAIAVALTLVVVAWNETEAATGDLPMRVFLVGWAFAAVIVSVGLPFANLASRRGQSSVRLTMPPAVHHVAMGLVIGLAVGTTDWTALQFAGWWQLWWTVPLLLVYASLIIDLRRSSRE